MECRLHIFCKCEGNTKPIYLLLKIYYCVPQNSGSNNEKLRCAVVEEKRKTKRDFDRVNSERTMDRNDNRRHTLDGRKMKKTGVNY